MFLHESWPWCKGQNALLSVAIDGTAKVLELKHSLEVITFS